MPAGRVIGRIGIGARVLEPCLPFPSIDQKMFHQKRCNNYAHAVVHPSCVLELTHTGIDDQTAGSDLAATLRALRGRAARACLQSGLQGPWCNIRVVIEKMIREFSPAKFRQELLEIATGNSI